MKRRNERKRVLQILCHKLDWPLYPDARDEPGKCVTIKVDSGPGRLKEMVSGEPRILRYYYKLLVCFKLLTV